MEPAYDISGKQQRAVIYCRVSGKKQTTDGSGLDSQEHRCRQYAAAKSYEVALVFPDDVSGSGDFMNRKGMVALLQFLDDHPHEKFVVIFDDLKRYSRDVEFHHKLRRHMEARNATRECLNFNFENSPEGKLKETITVAAGEYERESNARQNWQKSIARLEQGYSVQAVPPVGYKYVKSKNGGKVLVRDEPVASIVAEALEGYASGRFASQAELTRFLQEHPLFPKNGYNGAIRQWTVVEMLRRHLYAGLIDGRSWGVSIREGKHEGLISVATFERIQQKLDGGVYAPARKDIGLDFPLRGAVSCSSCDTPLTAGWSTGRYKKYPYYFCRCKTCSMYGKMIGRQKIETEFEAVLSDLQPNTQTSALFRAMFKNCWEMFRQDAAASLKAVKTEMLEVEKQISKLVDRIVEANSPRVVTAIEKRIDELETRQLVLREKVVQNGEPLAPFEKMFELSMRFLANPQKIWASGRFDLQRIVLRLAFSDYLSYSKEEGFLNTKKSLPFNAIASFFGHESKMVPEPLPNQSWKNL